MNALQIANRLRGEELRNSGIDLFEQEDYTNALLKFQEALKLMPNDIKSQLYQGLCKCISTPTESQIQEAIKEVHQAFQRYVRFHE